MGSGNLQEWMRRRWKVDLSGENEGWVLIMWLRREIESWIEGEVEVYDWRMELQDLRSSGVLVLVREVKKALALERFGEVRIGGLGFWV